MNNGLLPYILGNSIRGEDKINQFYLEGVVIKGQLLREFSWLKIYLRTVECQFSAGVSIIQNPILAFLSLTPSLLVYERDL